MREKLMARRVLPPGHESPVYRLESRLRVLRLLLAPAPDLPRMLAVMIRGDARHQVAGARRNISFLGQRRRGGHECRVIGGQLGQDSGDIGAQPRLDEARVPAVPIVVGPGRIGRLAPAYPLLAGYQPDLKGLGYQSGTMKAVWDNVRGLDLLDALPFVRPGRYAAVGHSLDRQRQKRSLRKPEQGREPLHPCAGVGSNGAKVRFREEGCIRGQFLDSCNFSIY